MVAVTRIAKQFDFELQEGASPLKKKGSGSYVVFVDDPDATPAEIAALSTAGSGPANGLWTKHVTQFPGEPTCVLRERTITREGTSPLARRVSLKFDVDRIEDDEDEENPLSRPMEVSLRTTLEQRATVWAPDGSPLINDAGSLYKDQTKDVVLFEYSCTFNNATPVDWPGQLAGYTNSTAVTIRGITWPPNTLKFINFTHAETPEYAGTVEYWPHAFTLVGDFDGYYRVLPNYGSDELVYERLRSVGTPARNEWQVCTVAQYNAEPAVSRQIRRAKIKNENKEETEAWIDANGQAITNPLIVSEELTTTGSITADNDVLTIPGAVMNESHVGSGISISGIGMDGRTLHTRIKSVLTTTTVELERDAVETASSDATVILTGVTVKIWDRNHRADFTTILPTFPT